MPFVPLGSRKPIPVVLDDEKARLAAKQREKDSAAVTASGRFEVGASGYRFANHPVTLGTVRHSRPFEGATSTWRPPEADPNGPAAKRDCVQAEWGGIHQGSHGSSNSMRRPKSLPILKPEEADWAGECHPHSTELRRFQKLGSVTEKAQMSDAQFANPYMPTTEQPRVYHAAGGLVNFPKYMLWDNCHMKQQDCMRFHKQQEELTKMAASGTSLASSFQSPKRTVRDFPEPTWGARRKSDDGGPAWAGNPLPIGRGSRSSNPFRTG